MAGALASKGAAGDEWLTQMAVAYPLPNPVEIELSALVDTDGVHRQRHFFYFDEVDKDGQRSYAGFLALYRGRSGWRIDDRGSYVVIRSTAGRPVEIYVNKPEQSTEGQEAIDIALTDKAVHMYVHRGHSYHWPDTLPHIKPDVRIAFVGACGGFQDLDEILQVARAHVISTKVVGSITVNGPWLQMFSEEVRVGRAATIQWEAFFAKVGRQLKGNKHFNDYVPPSKNAAALLTAAYYGATQAQPVPATDGATMVAQTSTTATDTVPASDSAPTASTAAG
ncbi:MAG: hypothetical protein AAB263_00455, partial [Planctomycetota bacterium]